MKPDFFPTAAHLLVCTDERCAARGSRLLFQSLWRGLEAERLAYYQGGGNLRLSQSGCLGACAFGPVVACYFKDQDGLQQAWYHGMNRERTLDLARALHAGLELPDQGRYDR